MSTIDLKPTPLEEYPELAGELGVEKLFIKREDQNPSGSHKDRAIWGMLDVYINKKCHPEFSSGSSLDSGQTLKQVQGDTSCHFVISSSGNAAISAAYYVSKKEDIKLDVFVSPNISGSKKQRLDEIINNSENIIIHESERAKSEAIKFAKENDYQLIRTSKDNLALGGYGELATEINNQIDRSIARNRDNLFDIFIPTSSGTTIAGINTRKSHTEKLEFLRMRFSLHAVQTTRDHVNIIAQEFDQDFEVSESSLASAIVDTIGHRKDEVVKAIKESNGSGWIISDDGLREARELLESKTDIRDMSWDSLLSLAGLMKALKSGRDIKNVILLFTGK